MNNLTKWWFDYKKLSPEDYKNINAVCPHKEILNNPIKYLDGTIKVRRTIPLGDTLVNHNLYVHEEARFLISKLFDKYASDDTLLVISECEHPCVNENTYKFKNVLTTSYQEKVLQANIDDIRSALVQKKYKRALVYIIGTQNTSGEITPQKFYTSVRDFLISKGVEPIIVIDDVHGMHLVPRDYSIFDYVIGTAHALLRHWDMGMMWSKNEEDFGEQPYNWLYGYVDALSFIIDRFDKINFFSYVMREELSEYIKLPYVEHIPYSAPHIFTLWIDCPAKQLYDQKTEDEYFEKEVELSSGDHDTCTYLRLRGAQYITFPEYFEEAVIMTKAILDKAVAIKAIYI